MLLFTDSEVKRGVGDMIKKNGNTRTMSRKWIAGAVLLFAFFVMAGIHIWKDYRDTLMKNQEDQLLIVTRILRDRPCGTSYDGTSGRF